MGIEIFASNRGLPKASQEINALDLSITEDRGKLDEIEFELKEEAIRLKASQKNFKMCIFN